VNNFNPQSLAIRAALAMMMPGGAGGQLSILLFHKVPREPDPLVSSELCLGDFEHILDFLKANTNVFSLPDAVAKLAAGTLPQRAVCISFDDGYAEWTQHVAAALVKRTLPATFFVTTEVLSGPALWHERIVAAVRALPNQGARLAYGFANVEDLSHEHLRQSVVRELQERLKYVPLTERLSTIDMLEAQAVRPLELPATFGAADVRSLHSQGFDIGAHTIRHPILNECTDHQAMLEIGGSKEELEVMTGGKVQFFAYPNGRPRLDFNARHVAMVKACGYKGAVASSGGVATAKSDIFQLPRTTTWGSSHIHMAYHLARNVFEKSQVVPPEAKVEQVTTDVRCLMVASTFAPIHGGSAVVYQNLCLHMPAGSIQVLAASHNYLTNKPIDGCQEHDRAAPYPIYRLPLLRPLMRPPPANMLVSIYRLIFQDMLLNTKTLLTAARIVHKHKVNIVCVGELVTGSWLGFALRRFFGCKVIIYVHGEEVTTATGGRLHGNRRGHYLRSADKVVAVSSFTCDALTRGMGMQPTSLALIQNGVDTDRFTPGPIDVEFLKLKGLSGKKIVLTVGRLVPRKGIDMAIRAMRHVVDQMPHVHHVIVGDGDYRPELERIIAQEQLQEYVTLVGKTTDEDLLSYLRSCDVFLMPNRTMPDGDTEGFGLVFREANACGKPVVGGNAGGAVEAVVDGKTGFLVDGTSPVDIAKAVLRLLSDVDLAAKLGANGLKLAQENNTKAVADRFIKICERILTRSPI